MKTITLSEEAYQRLKSWKTDPSESFSKVVLKVVPKQGTAGDMDKAFDKLPKLTRRQAEATAPSSMLLRAIVLLVQVREVS